MQVIPVISLFMLSTDMSFSFARKLELLPLKWSLSTPSLCTLSSSSVVAGKVWTCMDCPGKGNIMKGTWSQFCWRKDIFAGKLLFKIQKGCKRISLVFLHEYPVRNKGGDMPFTEAKLGLLRFTNYPKIKSSKANWSTCMKEPKLVPLHLYYLYVQTG